MFALIAQTDKIFGEIKTPASIAAFDTAPGANGFGLILFISNVIKLGTLVAGLWVFANIITAGLMFISGSGDKSVPDKAKDQIVHSVAGLAIIVLAYLLIALISFFFFGDPGYILNPTIVGPQGNGASRGG